MTLHGEEWLRKKIRHRLLHKNLNWLAIWVGPPGSGKSWSALRMAELLDDEFTIERVGFDVNAILERVWEWDLPRGSVVMLDEAGLAIDSRKWFEYANQALAYMVESFRFLGLAFLVTVPDPSFIDRVPRSLFNMSFDCIEVNHSEETVKVRPYRHQVNPRLQRVYHKGPKIKIPGKGWAKIRTMKFGRPWRTLTDAYEKARYNYMKTFHRKLLERGREMQMEALTMKERAKLVLDAIGNYDDGQCESLQNTRGFYDADLIQLEFDTTRGVARAVAKVLTQGSKS